jgi:outer membrane receptor protein involved in Fe transport
MKTLGTSPRFVSFLTFLAVLLVCSLTAEAQTSGTVGGTVTDPQGSVVPNASLTLINVATGLSASQPSNGAGIYLFNFVPPGTYKLTARAAGFKTATVDNLVVEVNKNTTVELKLAVGAINEVVTVSATNQGIDLLSAQVSTNIASTYLHNLPIFDRNVLATVALQPGLDVDTTGGAGFTASGGANAAVEANGNRDQRNVFYLDGANNTQNWRNGNYTMPNPDAVEEVEVTASNPDAEYGRQVGATINVITKSGTNGFHGTGFYFLRVKELNANSWDFNKNDNPRPADPQKRYGGTIGGPIWKNHTFFFFSFNGYFNNSSAGVFNHLAPTTAMLGGDFSALNGLTDQFGNPFQLHDPDTGLPLAGNKIPQNLLDQIVIPKLAAYLPTVSGGTPYAPSSYYAVYYSNPEHQYEYFGKLDHNLTNNQRLNFAVQRVNYNTSGQNYVAQVGGGAIAGLDGQINKTETDNYVGRHTWTISPTFLIESQFSYSRYGPQFTDSAAPEGDIGTLGGNWAGSHLSGRKYLPGFMISDGWWGQGMWAAQGWLGTQDDHNFRFGNKVTYLKGKHSLKFGYEITKSSLSYYDAQDGVQLGFDGRYSSGDPSLLNTPGNDYYYSMADFLMGRSNGFTTGGVQNENWSNWQTGLYGQDQWKVLPRLTLTLGLRYEVYTPPAEAHNWESEFLPGHQSQQYSSNPPPLGMAFIGDPGVPAHIYKTEWGLLAPRIGGAWDVTGNGKTALRFGFGQFYSYNPLQITQWLYEQNPWNQAVVCNGGLTGVTVSNPWPSCSPPYTSSPIPLPNSTNLNTYQWPNPIASVMSFQEGLKTPREYQWNFTLQRELARGITVQTGYVGNWAEDLLAQNAINAARYTCPGCPPPAGDSANIDARRPYQGYETISQASALGKSRYNGWQNSLSIDSFHGLQAKFTYTLQAGATNDQYDPTSSGNPDFNNPACPACDWGPDIYHHSFRAYYVYELPFLKNSKSWPGRLLGGWGLSGGVSVSSGGPMNVTLGQDWNYDGIGTDRPDLAGPIKYVKQQNSVGILWFDPSVFVDPPSHQVLGNLRYNALWGPGGWGWDSALMKDFRITEAQRFEFRLETYDIFNHPNLDPPDTTMSDGSIFGISQTKSGNRLMQIGMKYYF